MNDDEYTLQLQLHLLSITNIYTATNIWDYEMCFVTTGIKKMRGKKTPLHFEN